MPAVALGDVAQLDSRLAAVALGVLRRERARPLGPGGRVRPPGTMSTASSVTHAAAASSSPPDAARTNRSMTSRAAIA